MLSLGNFLCLKPMLEQRCKQFFSSYKMVLIVRKDLAMSTGKIAAQCAHAAVTSVESCTKSNNTLWKKTGQAKIVLQCENERALLEIYKQAKTDRLPASLICDAGRTQLSAGTYTVVGIGPASSSDIDKVTSKLKLLK